MKRYLHLNWSHFDWILVIWNPLEYWLLNWDLRFAKRVWVKCMNTGSDQDMLPVWHVCCVHMCVVQRPLLWDSVGVTRAGASETRALMSSRGTIWPVKGAGQISYGSYLKCYKWVRAFSSTLHYEWDSIWLIWNIVWDKQ